MTIGLGCVTMSEIGDKGAVAIAASVANLTSLTQLNLSYNKIGDDGAVAIANTPPIAYIHGINF